MWWMGDGWLWNVSNKNILGAHTKGLLTIRVPFQTCVNFSVTWLRHMQLHSPLNRSQTWLVVLRSCLFVCLFVWGPYKRAYIAAHQCLLQLPQYTRCHNTRARDSRVLRLPQYTSKRLYCDRLSIRGSSVYESLLLVYWAAPHERLPPLLRHRSRRAAAAACCYR